MLKFSCLKIRQTKVIRRTNHFYKQYSSSVCLLNEIHEVGNTGRFLDITAPLSHPKEVSGPKGLPSRTEQIRQLASSKKDHPYDVLIIGGGATGTGCALDAASRGLNVACIEKGDFGCETSSRSTKLIWAGIRYLASAFASLLSPRLLTNPIETCSEFFQEFRMVLNCHRERKYMLEKQGHLCNWVPIAIPFTTWYVKPAPFGHPLFSLFPMLAPLVFKFYDSLSGFSCPSSYVLGKKKAKLLFPQLKNCVIKYCCIFYEAQHNDSRTNLAIAFSAAEHGAHIANYVQMKEVIFSEDGKAIGVVASDRMSDEKFKIYARKIVFSGGPFTDSLRSLESENPPKAVASAGGTHIVLPGYYSSSEMGMLDYNTSDGRFLFFLPWLGHTLVGTTDVKCPAETLPTAPEDEVQWILNECGKYLSKDLRVRRSDVLSAWRGWRPLAVDPHALPDSPVSRDHVISENPETGIIFIAGGKWVTWREMAEDTISKITLKKCKTLDITLFGGNDYKPNLSIKLIQKYGMSRDVAEHLTRTYGDQAWKVCELSRPTQQTWPRFGVPLTPFYPYIDAEVRYACKEYACTIEDVLSRRTRLAFLNRDAALSALPKVADIMAEELGWTPQIKADQIFAAQKYIESFTGRIPMKKRTQLRAVTYRDAKDVFKAIDVDQNGFLDEPEVGEVAHILGFPMSSQKLKEAFSEMDVNDNGRVSLQEFENWWNHREDSYLRKKLTMELGFVVKNEKDLKRMGTGTFFG